jgi:predicted deacylase
MLTESVEYLEVGDAGAVKLAIPIYTIESDAPDDVARVLGITCAIHGDEHAGFFIAARLIDRLTGVGRLQGMIRIFHVANPAAVFDNQRVSRLDHMDLNRVGAGRHDGSYTERLAAKLFERLSKCQCVINIHEFAMVTPRLAVLVNRGSDEVKAKTLQYVRAFDPEIIWLLSKSTAGDAKYSSVLDVALAEHGIVVFPIEMTQLSLIRDEELDTVVEGLFQVAVAMEIIAGPVKSHGQLPSAFFRHEVTADEFGLWEPKEMEKGLPRAIKRGAVVGTLRTLPYYKSKEVLSPFDFEGALIQCRRRQLVSVGSSLFSVGEKTSLGEFGYADS